MAAFLFIPVWVKRFTNYNWGCPSALNNTEIQMPFVQDGPPHITTPINTSTGNLWHEWNEYLGHCMQYGQGQYLVFV